MLLVAFVVILLCAGTGVVALMRSPSSSVVARNDGAAPLSVIIDGAFGARFAGELAAKKNGFFDQHIDLRADPNNPDFVGHVARSQVIGVTSGIKFLQAAWQGAPVTAFAASLLDTPTMIFTLEGSRLRRPEDLIGKRLGYSKNSEGDMVIEAMLAQLRLPRSQITKVAGKDNFDALRSGEVDAIISSVGQQPRPSETGFIPVNAISPANYAIHVPGTVYFASADLLRDRPLAVLGVLEGLIRGWRFVYSDEKLSVPLIVGYDPERLDSDRVAFELQQQRFLVLPTGGRIADYDESRWRTLRDILLFSKQGEETIPLARLVTYQFLRDVYRRAPDLSAPSNGSPVN